MSPFKPLGYTTVVLREGELEGDYPVYYQDSHRTQEGPEKLRPRKTSSCAPNSAGKPDG